MGMDHRWIAAVLASAALAACASTPSPAARPVAQAATPAAAPGASAQRVYVTGSLIAVPVDPHTGVPQTASPMQIVSQDDLRHTGRTDLASALREVVPALH